MKGGGEKERNARTRDYATVSSRRERIIRCVSPTLLLRILPLKIRRDPLQRLPNFPTPSLTCPPSIFPLLVGELSNEENDIELIWKDPVAELMCFADIFSKTRWKRWQLTGCRMFAIIFPSWKFDRILLVSRIHKQSIEKTIVTSECSSQDELVSNFLDE